MATSNASDPLAMRYRLSEPGDQRVRHTLGSILARHRAPLEAVDRRRERAA